jgi:periplasmic divalent cation tolerance protein
MTELLPTDVVEVVVTADDPEWLAAFTRSLVEDRLVACGHTIAPIRSVYRWDGSVHDDRQARVGLHTTAGHITAIVARADQEHPDDVPCVIAVPVVGGHPAYLCWVAAETSGSA